MDNKEVEKSKKIEKQVESWDIFAKIVPVFFLFFCFVLLSMGVDADLVFYVGIVLFALTAVTWWFWAIFSIRFLVKLLGRTSQKLLDVGDELRDVKKEYKRLIDDEDNSSKHN